MSLNAVSNRFCGGNKGCVKQCSSVNLYMNDQFIVKVRIRVFLTEKKFEYSSMILAIAPGNGFSLLLPVQRFLNSD